MGANDRNTRTLDREELAKLARESLEAKEVDEADAEGQAKAEDPIGTPEVPPQTSRTATLQDPMTMALLAEVTRNARTQEFDPEEMPEHEDTPVHPHPNIRRRST